jgi:AcrR family transcriptional regulator
MVRIYENTEVRQRQIIDAARKVIIKYGSEHVTVKKIAGEVGISEAAIYRHYKSKRDILSFLIENIGELMAEDISLAAAGKFENRLQLLDNVIKNHLSSIEQRKGISFQVIAEIISLGDKKLNKKASQVIGTYIDQLKNLITEGVSTGEIRKDVSPDAAALILFGIIQGIVNLWALNNYGFDPQEKFASVWKTYLEAIKTH